MSAPVINVRFKLASFLSQRKRTTRTSVGSRRLHVFPDMKRAPTFGLLRAERRDTCRIIPTGRNQPRIARLICILNDVEENVMKALLGLGRNDVIKAAALVAIVVFPLLAHAQLGRSSGAALKTSQDVAPVAGAAARTAAAAADSCADQHWPFFSAGCLRGSTQAAEPRLVSMNVEPSANSATTGDAAKAVRTVDIVPNNGPKKTAKPRIAGHRHERRTPNVNYAANFDAGHMPGW
jgi:hypothetical protein